jgi:hypothetical protein
MKRLLKGLLWIVVAGFLLLVFLPVVAPFLTLAFTIAFGWIGFLRRVMPAVIWNPDAIGMFVVCSLLALAGIQSFGGWVRGDAGWRWKWTLNLYAGLWLLFLTVMGATGVAHQATWLILSKEPWFETGIQARASGAIARNEMKNLALQAIISGEDHDWKLRETQADFWTEASAIGMRPSPREKFQTLFLPGKSNRVAAIIILPRSRDLQRRIGLNLVASISGSNQRDNPAGAVEFPIADLPRLLRQYGGEPMGSHPTF